MAKSWVLAIFLISSGAAAVSTGTRGGGNIVFCKQSGSASAELLDFYEARILKGTVPVPAAGQEIKAVLKKMAAVVSAGRDSQFQERLWILASRILNTMVLVPAGTRLTPFDDSHHVVAPENCEIAQAALYLKDGTVLVREDYWNLMDTVNKAGLILHEALYEQFRFFGATDSRRVRNAVAMAAAGVEAEPIMSDLPPEHLVCQVDMHRGRGLKMAKSRFYVSRDPLLGNVQLRFAVLNGEPILSRSVATLGMKLQSLDEFLTTKSRSLGLLINDWIDSRHEKLLVSIYFESNATDEVGFLGNEAMPSLPSDPFQCKREAAAR